tara:strand:+ start:176 stop:445 length:270 start_codon:yes stop_codon:yes gene_type:complete
MLTKKELAATYKSGAFAWPGGYPFYIILTDGDLLCWKCFKREYKSLVDDIDSGVNTGWMPEGADVLWEGVEHCGHCAAPLESAYGPDPR